MREDWQDTLGIQPEQAASWWTDQPYSLLVATGLVLDAIEVNGEVGRLAAGVLRTFGMPVPIIATPEGRWLFLTAAGQELGAELANAGEVTLHGAGSWVSLPPTPYQHGVVHWRVKPEVCGWRLPDSLQVQEAVVGALTGEDVLAST